MEAINLKQKNEFQFSLVISVFALCISIMEMIISFIYLNLLDVYAFELSFVSIVFVGILIFLLSTKKERKWYDFALVSALTVIWLISFIQISFFTFRSTVPLQYLSADYSFPCFIKIFTYATKAGEPICYQLIKENVTYNFNFLISIALSIIFAALYIHKAITCRKEK
ncbi:MAG: hypothetical protein RR416_05195 [Clostridia bacterium]